MCFLKGEKKDTVMNLNPKNKFCCNLRAALAEAIGEDSGWIQRWEDNVKLLA